MLKDITELQERKWSTISFLTITCHSERAKGCMNLGKQERQNWCVSWSEISPVCSSTWFPCRLYLRRQCEPLHGDNNRNSTHTPTEKIQAASWNKIKRCHRQWFLSPGRIDLSFGSRRWMLDACIASSAAAWAHWLLQSDVELGCRKWFKRTISFL